MDIEEIMKEAKRKIIESNGQVTDKPKVKELTTLRSRKLTLINVDFAFESDIKYVDSVAEAGFFLDYQSGSLVCFHCEVLVDLSSGRDPWKTHLWFSPSCGHVRQCKGDKFVLDTLNDWINNSVAEIDTELDIDSIISSNKNVYDDMVRIHNDESIIKEAVVAFAIKEKRYKFTTEDLDAKIKEIKANQVQTVERDTEPDTNEDDLSEADKKRIEEENERLWTEVRRCIICYNHIACIVILPCGHRYCCPQCIPPLEKCPYCRGPIAGTVHATLVPMSEVVKCL